MLRAEPARLSYLDSARGLAALSVITWHCYTAIVSNPEASKLYTSPFHFFLYGEADMIFFFIHSGFILSFSNPAFENEIAGTTYLKYIIRRLARIYPLFLFILILSYALKSVFSPVEGAGYLSLHFQKFWHNKTSITDLMKQGLLAIRIPDNANLRLIPQDWTLTVEILLSPIIPLINFINHKSKIICWLLILFALKLFNFNTYLFEFTIGVNLFSFRNQISELWSKCNWPIKLIFFLAGIVLYTCVFNYPNIFSRDNPAFSPALDRIMVVTGCTIFFIFVLNSGVIQKIFKIPVLVKIGKICYSLYLNHIFLLICFSNFFLLLLHRLIKGPDWVFILIFVLFFQLLTIMISLITYNLIEKPFNKWGKKLGARMADLLGKKFRFLLPHDS
jgi:peptidoglycan/LPS O-acetylase OafA/YrhL